MGQKKKKEIKQNWKGTKRFDICVWVNFSCLDQSLISVKETSHCALPPTNFRIFLVFPGFLWCQVLGRLATSKATHLQNSFYYKALLYMWQIKHILQCCIVSLYHFCDCQKKVSLTLYNFCNDSDILNSPIFPKNGYSFRKAFFPKLRTCKWCWNISRTHRTHYLH